MTSIHAELETHLLALEAERSRALVQEDHAQVARLFADDLVYVHTTGLVHDKAQYLAYAQNVVRYLSVERGALQVRFAGDDLAIMTGPHANTLQKRGAEHSVASGGFTTQIWRRSADAWQICSFHATRVAEA
ncbi:hypothetical protein PMM47T1_08491 [Pseudomonas sp. M47T1]|uniref:nuclear transport factor 2 family protein n=1 Tax=Pseudomonas sp. M47T1 TaxID=1179778 RepID=UPI0002607B05|nr:nuclear transport factor 2 family protein [Pseudomonas sp. M47T1]EIK97166.1 hypothetical protein PMM47T1_08491 [Pseudomonas sp. M47T1]